MPVMLLFVGVLRLPLASSDRVPVVVVAADVVFQLHFEGERRGDKDVDREHVDVVDVDKGL